MQHILVTGGTGFIGSHTVVALQEAGYEVVIIDNLSNSTSSVVDRITTITGITPTFIELDLQDKIGLQKLFASYHFDAVIHFAGLKAVGTSCQQPFIYWQQNIGGTMHLLEVMDTYQVKSLVFSSSATVYDTTLEKAPFDESMRTGHTTNPYGTTKHIIEQLLQDMVLWKGMRITALRYFNPIGAHGSGLLGEDPRDEPTNLLPVMMEVLEGKRDVLTIYGDAYTTPDGTCIRDYVDVGDVAEAHVVSLGSLLEQYENNYNVYNVGTGVGTSVLEMIHLVEIALGKSIPHVIGSPRTGDVPVVIADVKAIKKDIGWVSQVSLVDAIRNSALFRQKLYK